MKPKLWLRIRKGDCKFACCWPDLGHGLRAACSRQVEYVGLQALSRIPSPEFAFHTTTFALCAQHWGKRNA